MKEQTDEQKALRDATSERRTAFRRELEYALTGLGFVGIVWEHAGIRLDGVFFTFSIEMERVMFRESDYTGRLFIKWYDGKQNRRYPEPKKGFDVSAWALRLREAYHREMERRSRHGEYRELVDQWEKKAMALMEKMVVPNHILHWDSEGVEVRIPTMLTIEQAEVLLTAAIKCGAIKQLEEKRVRK